MTSASAGLRWATRQLLPFVSPIVVATGVYFATLGSVLRAHGGENQDLAYAVRKSVDATRGRKFEVLFLGNSRVVRGVDPTFLEASAHNFAFDDDTFLYYLYKARLIARTGHHVRHAFIGVDAFQLAYWNYDRYFAYRECFADPEFDAWAFDVRYGPRLISQVVEKKVALRYTYRAGILGLARSRITGAPSVPPSADTYQLEPNGFYRVRYEAPRTLDPATIPRAGLDEHAVNLLERTIEEFRSAGVDVTLFTPPASTRFRSLDGDAARTRALRTMTDIAARHGVRYVSWEDDPHFVDTDFPDEVHLSVDGAERFTRLLSGWMVSHGFAEPSRSDEPARDLTE